MITSPAAVPVTFLAPAITAIVGQGADKNLAELRYFSRAHYVATIM